VKVLIVSQYFWPEQFRINDLAHSLKTRGHEVCVLTGMPNYPSGKLAEGYSWWKQRREQMSGVVVRRTPLFLRRQGRGWQLALNYLSFVLFGCLMGPWYFRKHDFDVIFVFEPSPFTVGIPAMLMRRLKKAPMFFWVQDLWPESLEVAGAVRSQGVLRWVGKMVRWIYGHCDRVLVQSKGFIEPAVMAGADHGRILYFPNWAEELYQPMTLAPDAPELAELPEGFTVMFAGNLGEAQSLETIVDAAARVKGKAEINWIIVGDGRRKSAMQQRVERLGLGDSVRFLGRKPVEAMPRYYAAADVLLVTLKAAPVFARTIPSKVQSYLACGKPIAAALDGEGANVIKSAGAGIVVAAEDSEALAGAVQKLYSMEAGEREKLGANGRGYFENEFAADMLVSRLEAWMNEVVEEGLCES
jgi:glycosyltransferase involved in cell wall biosynthesis